MWLPSERRAGPGNHKILSHILFLLLPHFNQSHWQSRSGGRYRGGSGRGRMQEWKCGSGEKDSSSVVNVSTGRRQVRGVSDERQCQGESQRNRVKEVRGYYRQMVEPSARFSH